MTGLFSRVRAWLGSVFGNGGDDESAGDDGTQSTGSDRRVVHRDDRPLETPKALSADADHTLKPTAPSEASEGGATDDAADAPVDVPDADGDSAPDADIEISIPDAEPTTTDAEAADGDEADADFACSVCGTAVEDPDATCPLCHSSDVVPAGEASDGAPSRRGRTEVSQADDDAVDRLRDVQGDGG